MWLESDVFLKVVPTGAPAGLDAACERTEGTKGARSDSGLRSWPFPEGGRPWAEQWTVRMSIIVTWRC